MLKCLVVLAIVGTMSVPAAAQTTPSAPATDHAQAAKPQMVKKRVCEESNDDPYSRIKTKTCKTVMVPAQPGATESNGATSPTPAPQPNAGN